MLTSMGSEYRLVNCAAAELQAAFIAVISAALNPAAVRLASVSKVRLIFKAEAVLPATTMRARTARSAVRACILCLRGGFAIRVERTFPDFIFVVAMVLGLFLLGWRTIPKVIRQTRA